MSSFSHEKENIFFEGVFFILSDLLHWRTQLEDKTKNCQRHGRGLPAASLQMIRPLIVSVGSLSQDFCRTFHSLIELTKINPKDLSQD